MSQIVTRFAPSPTGHLHIGGARTAIFNWLLAKNAGGKFFLRIEDTDRARSSQEMTDAILDSLSWLGISWDGEPIYQSERSELYNQCVEKLLETGHAYWCSCTPEEVDAMREKARAEGKKPKYDGSCREKGLGPGENHVVRFKGPETGKTVFKDMVKGMVAVEHAELDDMVIRRPDGSATYNLAVVVDDSDMGVTRIVRGEDHLSNTPRQILIYEALGLTPPEFGHVPLIHGPDKKKLSKRHGARSVTEYRDDGLLPEALFNYLVRLGWSLGDQEIFSRDELVASFTTDNLSSSAAAFDPDKLAWLSAHYIKEADPAHLAKLLPAYLEPLGFSGVAQDKLAAIVPLYQPRAKSLVEMAESARFFLVADADLEYDAKAVKKILTDEAAVHLAKLKELFAGVEPFTVAGLEEAAKQYLDENELKFKAIAQPLRVAVSGSTVSPGIFETLEVLGRDSVLGRMSRALDQAS